MAKRRVRLRAEGRPYCAIDPGVSGALAIVHPNDVAFVYALPTYTVRKGKKARRQLALAETWELVKSTWAMPPSNALPFYVIEEVASMPNQGVVSTCTFCGSVGALKMALIAAGIPHTPVLPREWKKHWRLINKAKDESLLVIERLYPDLREYIGRNHNMADALLMARYARDMRLGV